MIRCLHQFLVRIDRQQRAYLKFECDGDQQELERARKFAILISESKNPLKYAGRTVNFLVRDLVVLMSHLTNDAEIANVANDDVWDETGDEPLEEFDSISVDECGYCFYPITNFPTLRACN